jgi:hypothetical protein
MSPETKQQHWLRRGQQLRVKRKAELCALYRRLGGLGGIHPPEKWTKDEVVTSIIEIEWRRLPDDQKIPDPPFLTPPCDECGAGENATAHHYGGDHNYRYTQSDKPWVPASEKEAERIARDFPQQEVLADEEYDTLPPEEHAEIEREIQRGDHDAAEEQPSGAQATAFASWRVHLIYTHGTENMPVSFRTTVQAAGHNTALIAASKALERHGQGIGLTNLRIRSYASCERVPVGEQQ